MFDYSRPDPLPEDLLSQYNLPYQAYVILGTKNTGTPNPISMLYQINWIGTFQVQGCTMIHKLQMLSMVSFMEGNGGSGYQKICMNSSRSTIAKSAALEC